ncbi:MAG: c-type cytochrome [bacterium]
MRRISPFLSLIVCLACQAEPPADITDPGELLFLGYAKKEVNCARCHGPQGRGGMLAPGIQDVFKKYDEETIADIIEEGKGDDKEAMPPLEGVITEEELHHLIRFLRTLTARDSS